MRKLRSNLFLVALAIYACLNNFAHAAVNNASYQDAADISGAGTFNNVSILRVDSNANIFFSSWTTNGTTPAHTTLSSQGVLTSSGNWVHVLPGKDFKGSPTVAVSTTNTALQSQGDIFTAFVVAGTNSPNVVEGNVLCSTTPAANTSNVSVTVCPSSGSVTNWVGIAAGAASSGTVVNVFVNGWVLALTTGPVVAGDVLVTTTTAQGVLTASMLGTMPNVAGAQVGVALGAGPSPASGLTKIRLR